MRDMIKVGVEPLMLIRIGRNSERSTERMMHTRLGVVVESGSLRYTGQKVQARVTYNVSLTLPKKYMI